MTNWNGQRVLILGAARQGTALARYLASRGARVTVSDKRSLDLLTDAHSELHDLPIVWAAGGHPLELLNDCDCLCISGGVPLSLPIVIEARRRGIRLTNDSQIFMEIVPCPVVGITGSAGKTTTTTMVGRIAQAGYSASRPGRNVWVGGNIGQPLINQAAGMRPWDLVVLELSSFQLELMRTSPRIAAVLNLTPNHLDRHGDMSAYTAAKRRILDFQTAEDIAVLCREDEGSWDQRRGVKGRLFSFGFEKPAQGEGVWTEGDEVMLRRMGETAVLASLKSIHLPGRHNQLNFLAACAISAAAGLDGKAIESGVQNFQGVAHRLELVRELNGVRWYNDSIATSPERSMAAIRSFSQPIVLLLGGRDKKLPWDELARLIQQRVDHVVIFGESAPLIEEAVSAARKDGRPASVRVVAEPEEAVQIAARLAAPGSVVLFSPGGTSYDQFVDFEERGEKFRKWVTQLS